MTHRRQRIRDAVVERLTSEVTATVVASRVHNWQVDQLPGVAVYTLDEVSEAVTQSRTQQRGLTLVIDIYVCAAGDIDDALDALCLEVERAMETDWTFDRLALRSDLALTRIGLSGDADNRHGIAHLEYSVVYRCVPGAPDA